jgi:hypothetical protein
VWMRPGLPDRERQRLESRTWFYGSEEHKADFWPFLAFRSFETTDADAFDGTGHKNGLFAQRGRAQLRFRLLVALQYKPTESDSRILAHDHHQRLTSNMLSRTPQIIQSTTIHIPNIFFIPMHMPNCNYNRPATLRPSLSLVRLRLSKIP